MSDTATGSKKRETRTRAKRARVAGVTSVTLAGVSAIAGGIAIGLNKDRGRNVARKLKAATPDVLEAMTSAGKQLPDLVDTLLTDAADTAHAERSKKSKKSKKAKSKVKG